MKILKVAMIFAVLATALFMGMGSSLRLAHADDDPPPVEEPVTGDMPQ